MNTYHSTKPMPYVYMCIHKETGHYYIGYREANSNPSTVDLPEYKTSSKKIRPNFENYNWHILAEFFLGEDAYHFEQQLISENWGDPLLLNQQHRYNAVNKFKTNKGRIHSEETREKIRNSLKGKTISLETREKMRIANAGRIPWNKGKQTGPASEERRKKISEALTGRERSLEHKQNLSKARKGSIPWNKGKSGSQIPWNKGVPNPIIQGENNPSKRLDVREKIRQKALERWAKRKAGIAPACV